MRSLSIPALILSLGVAACGLFIAYSIVDSRKHNQYVQVKGLSEKIVKSNQAIWTIQFKTSDNDLNELYQNIAKGQQAVIEFLIKQGFARHEVHINPVSVVDNQSNSYTTNQNMKRFSANSGISLTTDKVDAVILSVQKTDALVQNGIVVTSSNTHYRYTKLNSIKPQMLDEATDNAKKAALSFANNAQSQLGKIKQARQGVFTITDAFGSFNSGNDVMKKVRIVTTVEYFLKN